jgi:tryptophan synthase alpha chain
MKRIEELRTVFQKDLAAFMPYFTLGYPDMETSLDIIEVCAANGADLIELGIPFSDPLADGPTIQHSTQIALQNGVTLANCIAGLATLRQRGVTIPLILMGYINPILSYGLEQFVSDAFSAGAHGFIIPDLPPDEAAALQTLCKQRDMALIFLLAPNSPDDRIKLVTEQTTGFVYLVSITGVTGVRQELPKDLWGDRWLSADQGCYRCPRLRPSCRAICSYDENRIVTMKPEASRQQIGGVINKTG